MEIGVSSGDGFGSVCADSARSDFSKQEKSGESWMASKMAKHDFSLTVDATLPYFQHMEAAQSTNSGGYYSCGGLDSSSGVYVVSGVRGPFTPSQWIELEQQALIYKYMVSNEPIPLHLLIPIRRAFESAGFYAINGVTLKSNSWGWGPFHLGYSNSNDPEPGRCRRTDGKKWRCAKDAVSNQKYCDKHMNRGRHRSRKHVEGQSNGHSVSTNKSSLPPSAAASATARFTFNIDHRQHFQGKTFNAAPNLNRMNPNSLKHQICNQEAALIDFRTSITSPFLDDVASQKFYSADGLSTNNFSLSMGPADFMSSTSSPINEKPSGSPPRLSKDLSPRAAKWNTVSWEVSMGGPLAEALQSSSTGNNTDESVKSAVASLSNSTGSSPRVDNNTAIASLLPDLS